MLESDPETKEEMIHVTEICILLMMFIGSGYQETTETKNKWRCDFVAN